MEIPTTGTYVDAWWGIYAPAKALLVANELGAPVTPEGLALAHQEIASSADNPNATDPITLEEHDILQKQLDLAESWLNNRRAWHDRTSWGWNDGEWGHQTSPDPDQRPAVRFWADIYSHDSDPTGPEDAVDSGYFDPNYSAWWPVTDSDGREHPRHELDLLDLLDLAYHPNHLAMIATDRALRWIGCVDHIDTNGTTLIAYGAETVDDLRGTRGAPLASHWAIRRAELVNLTPDELDRCYELLNRTP
jgi:hypothetical protein